MRSYAVIEEGDVWLAISGRLGVMARDRDPANALTRCLMAEDARDRMGLPASGLPSGRECLEIACRLVGLDFGGLIGGKMCGVVARRSIVWWLVWKRSNGVSGVFSSIQIAEWSGQTASSTVQTACARVDPLITMPEWAELESAWRLAIEQRHAQRVDREPWCKAILRKLRDRDA